jgi:hypothetical protein
VSEEELDREVLERVGMNRRGFIKRVVLGTAFASPVIASFSMSGLSASSAQAQTGNQNQGPLGRVVSEEARSGAGGDLGQELGGSAREGFPPGRLFPPPHP